MDEQNNPGQPSTAEVLAEVERRRAKARRPVSKGQHRVVILADRFIFWLSKHWLAIFNALAFLYVGLPTLAPVLMHLGLTGPALLIHAIYRPQCNQLPQRSWFLFGPQFTYTPSEFMERVGIDVVHNLLVAGTFVGDEVVGYKMGLCERCTAIYGAILLSGLLYALGRRRVRPLPLWAYVSFGLLPMGIDGGYQFLSAVLLFLRPDFPIRPYESTPLMRVVTGLLFGLTTVWLAYPLVQETMKEFHDKLQRRFGWK